jgi:hypothetical protein
MGAGQAAPISGRGLPIREVVISNFVPANLSEEFSFLFKPYSSLKTAIASSFNILTKSSFTVVLEVVQFKELREKLEIISLHSMKTTLQEDMYLTLD